LRDDDAGYIDLTLGAVGRGADLLKDEVIADHPQPGGAS
jgi:hypothetical protein